MTLKQTFCPSPWFHMRITPSGHYEYCRWAEAPQSTNIQTQTPVEFFQQGMQPVRQSFLNGTMPAGCHTCRSMEQHGKVSGRQKQLLKVGVRLEEFEKTLASSPWLSVFTGNKFSQLPQDWQIELGNFCNSACIFCFPESSSRFLPGGCRTHRSEKWI